VTGEDAGSTADPITTYTPPIAPASATFYDGPIEEWVGELFIGTLTGRHLRRVTVDSGGGSVLEQRQLLGEEYGRLRTAFTGPDGHLYVTTSNHDGGGHPAPTDDRVLRIRPA
jgi:glucose/arabinose dehydrogenase